MTEFSVPTLHNRDTFYIPFDSQILVGWLIWALRPFETVFQSLSGRLPERGSKKREMIDKR